MVRGYVWASYREIANSMGDGVIISIYFMIRNHKHCFYDTKQQIIVPNDNQINNFSFTQVYLAYFPPFSPFFSDLKFEFNFSVEYCAASYPRKISHIKDTLNVLQSICLDHPKFYPAFGGGHDICLDGWIWQTHLSKSKSKYQRTQEQASCLLVWIYSFVRFV